MLGEAVLFMMNEMARAFHSKVPDMAKVHSKLTVKGQKTSILINNWERNELGFDYAWNVQPPKSAEILSLL